MKKIALFVSMFFMTASAWADAVVNTASGAVTAVPAVVIPTNAIPSDNWITTLLKSLIGILIVAIIPIMKNLFTFLAQKEVEIIAQQKNSYVQLALALSGAAVRSVETSYGPDTSKGKEKKDAAVNLIMSHNIPGITLGQAQEFVDAAYADAFLLAPPLSGTQAPKPPIA